MDTISGNEEQVLGGIDYNLSSNSSRLLHQAKLILKITSSGSLKL